MSRRAPLDPKAEELWRETLEQLRLQTTRATFDAYLYGCRLLRAEGGAWEVSCRHELAADWLNNRLGPMINRVAGGIAGQPVSIRFVVPAPVERGGGPAPDAASRKGADWPRRRESGPAPAPGPQRPAGGPPSGWDASWNDSYIRIKLAFRRRALAELRGAPLSVFLCLALHVDRSGVAQPGIKVLMSETGYCRTAVCSGLDELERLDLIRRAATPRVKSGWDAYEVLAYAWFGSDAAPSLWEEEDRRP